MTVGSATLEGLPLWIGQGLDFYQAHWYDKMQAHKDCARCTDYAEVRIRHGETIIAAQARDAATPP